MPLFEILQAFGDAAVTNQLEQAAKDYTYYATMALAGMDEGVGVPSLVRLARDPEFNSRGKGDAAIRMLAQVAFQYPAAAEALLEPDLVDQIRDSAWPAVAGTLAGGHLQYAGPVYSSSVSRVEWSDHEIRQRLAMIDKLLQLTSSQAGREALYQARQSLVARTNTRSR